METTRKKNNLLSRLTKVTLFLTLLYSYHTIAEPSLNGVATHAELGKEQFIGGLFTTTLTESSITILTADEPKKLQVRVLAKQLSSRRFKRMWIEGMAINASPAELERHAQNMAKFSNMLKIKLIFGDIFTVDRTLDNVSVMVNDTILGQIDDPSFFDLLLRTWIGPVPLSSDFRKDLLTEGSIKPGPLTRFQATQPSEERISIIANAMAAKRSVTAPSIAGVDVPAIQAPITAPTLPKVVVNEPEKKTPVEPKKEIPKVAIAPKKIIKPTPTKAPQKKVVKAKPSPKPVAPKKVALAPMEEDLDESIFDEGDDIEFTAESLLKEQLYYSRLAKYTHRFLTYPQKAWDRGREGNVRLRVTIDRTGNVMDSEILEASEHKSLNKEAKKAITRATPYPAIPQEIQGDEYTFTFRVAFKIVDSY